jgi:DMSO/TMAO reductase YedYZ molybdopterin-dependent catalytic subunit
VQAVNDHPEVLDRRGWLRRTAAAGLLSALPAGCRNENGPPPPDSLRDDLMRFPGKVPLRVLSDRPPCLETPWRFFRTDLTPVDAFFVRWHLQAIPTVIDLRTWRLRVGGNVRRPLKLTLDELRRMKSASVVAVNQCSGNSRGLFDPPVPGGQWGNGAMGNARWTGVRLRDVLERAGLKAGTVEVAFAGLDKGGPPSVPDFIKSLPVEEARRRDVLLAYAMNAQPLPLLNGFPLRVVVPGWYATYWVKALDRVDVRTTPLDGFWMNPAYRIPPTPNGVESPTHLAKVTIPINRMNVRSFFTSPEPGARVPLGRPCELDGIAFDGGSGIKKVEVSGDGGKSWREAELGEDLGNYSFRRWRLAWQPETAGEQTWQVRATSKDGKTQPSVAGWNRSGYMRNVIESLTVQVV